MECIPSRIPEPKTQKVLDAYLINFEEETDATYFGIRKVIKAFVSGIGMAKAPKLIIDIGCGPGYTTQALADAFRNARVVGVDVAERAIEMAREKWKWRTSPEFIVGDASKVLLEYERSADLVTFFSSFHEFDDGQRALNNTERALTDDGAVFISDVDRSLFLKMPFFLESNSS